jgi:hypothetical protein
MVGCGGGGAKYSLTMVVAPAGNGTATDLTNASPYTAGTAVSIKAVAAAGYGFRNWTAPAGTFVNANVAQTTFTMPAQHVTVTANFAPFAGGSGTEGDPYQIADWYQLHNVRNYLDSYFILVNNLNSTTAGYMELASPTANEGKGWQPIGYGNWDGQQWTGEMFEGTFDGQDYEIGDLFINRPDEIEVGLFGFVYEGGTIKNISVMNATVTGSNPVGGLLGVNCYGTVSDSYSSGSVTGNLTVGGLVGVSYYGTVSDSYSTGSVTGNSGVGGLVGLNSYGTVSNSYSTGSVTGNSSVGGLLGGQSYWSTVSNSYATGSVTGNSSVGGLLGQNYYNSIVSNSYSTGSVTGGGSYVGGLVGMNYHNSTVSNSYSTGSVSGDERVGGLVGLNDWSTVSNSYSIGSVTGDLNVDGLVGYNNGGTVSNSFWDTQTSGQDTSDGGTGKTTAEMMDITAFTDARWDIIAVANSNERNPTYIWNIVDDETYPFLNWQPV